MSRRKKVQKKIRPGREGALSRAILAARDRLGLSLKDFAGAVNERSDNVNHIESGAHGFSIERGVRWASALGLPVNTFVEPFLKDEVRAAGIDCVTLVKLLGFPLNEIEPKSKAG